MGGGGGGGEWGTFSEVRDPLPYSIPGPLGVRGKTKEIKKRGSRLAGGSGGGNGSSKTTTITATIVNNLTTAASEVMMMIGRGPEVEEERPTETWEELRLVVEGSSM